MGKKYELLRLAFKSRGLTLEDVGREILGGKTMQTVSDKMNGRIMWSIEEAYMVLERLSLPQDWMTLLFPRKGMATVTNEQREMVRAWRVS